MGRAHARVDPSPQRPRSFVLRCPYSAASAPVPHQKEALVGQRNRWPYVRCSTSAVLRVTPHAARRTDSHQPVHRHVLGLADAVASRLRLDVLLRVLHHRPRLSDEAHARSLSRRVPGPVRALLSGTPVRIQCRCVRPCTHDAWHAHHAHTTHGTHTMPTRRMARTPCPHDAWHAHHAHTTHGTHTMHTRRMARTPCTHDAWHARRR